MKQRLFPNPVGKHINIFSIYKFTDYLFLFLLKGRKPKSVCSSGCNGNNNYLLAIILHRLSFDFFADVNVIVPQYILREVQVLQQQTRPDHSSWSKGAGPRDQDDRSWNRQLSICWVSDKELWPYLDIYIQWFTDQAQNNLRA